MMRARTAALVLGFAAAAGALAPVRAEVQRIAADGMVYRVDVDTYIGNGKPNGTLLRTTRQRAKGGRDTFVVTGTDDAVADRDPALEIDPASGKPILVWARAELGGFNLFISKFDGAWSAPRLLAKLDGDDLAPEIHFDDRLLHVSWRQDLGGVSTYWRSSFNPATWQQVYGPERVPTDDPSPVPTDGGPEINGNVSSTDQYFCSSTLGRTVTDPSRATIWGVRDEPVPIGYARSFVLPSEIRLVQAQGAGFLGGRLTLWITTNDRLYYTTLANGRWADMRVVEITPLTSAADARFLIEDINRRLGAETH
jgi:hypothetical protein